MERRLRGKWFLVTMLLAVSSIFIAQTASAKQRKKTGSSRIPVEKPSHAHDVIPSVARNLIKLPQ